MRWKHNPCIEERDWELEHKRTGWLWLGAVIRCFLKREGRWSLEPHVKLVDLGVGR